jgi:hypothetical protein
MRGIKTAPERTDAPEVSEPSPVLQRGPRLLLPVLSLTDRLRTRSRLLLLVALLLVPSLLAAGSFATVIGGQVRFAEYERAGVRVVGPAVQAMASSAAGREPDLRHCERPSRLIQSSTPTRRCRRCSTPPTVPRARPRWPPWWRPWATARS